MVLAHREGGMLIDWCAVEIQAVYFSGDEISKDYKNIREHSGNGVPMPGGSRRPDFRSSGPKRLMPQLQVKVPTLRRWGKKMIVVIDQPFFEAMDPMDNVDHVSNADIVWVIASITEPDTGQSANIGVHNIEMTTLEDAIDGLIAGEPTTLPDFENSITKKLFPTEQ